MRIQQLAPYLKNKDYKRHQGLLIYGNDDGAIQFHLDCLCHELKEQGYQIDTAASLGDVDTGQEPGLFLDESSGPKATICRGVTGRDFERVKEVLENLGADHICIFVAGNLNAKVRLVTHFQNDPALGSIPSYDVSLSGLRQVIQNQLTQKDISLSKDHIEVLVEVYAGSPVFLFNDMEKIALYALSKPDMSIEDLRILTNGTAALNLDGLMQGFMRRDKKMLLSHAHLDFLDAEPFLILRSLSRQLMTFGDYLAHLSHEGSSSRAFQALKTPVFFKTKDLFQESGSKWNQKLLGMALKRLLSLEYRIKLADLSPEQFQAEIAVFCR